MSDDPTRLLEGGSDLLRTLITAAREEAPEAAALRRTLVAVGVASAIAGVTASASASTSAAVSTAGAGAAKAASSSTLLVVVKWLAIGAITGTVASSAVYGVSGALTPPAAVSSVARVRTPSAPTAVPARRSIRVEEAAVPEIPAAPMVVPPAPATAPVRSAPAELDEAPLAAEVAALDGARQALRAGNAARTLELLNGYEARFREARMLPEALYLRLEAFTLAGDQSSAEAVAQRILRGYPASPHAARARAVLGISR